MAGALGMMARGGQVPERDIRRLEDAGRFGDTMLAHISPEEAAILKQMGGSGTINPTTGLPEFFWDEIISFVGDLFSGGGSDAAAAVADTGWIPAFEFSPGPDTFPDLVKAVAEYSGDVVNYPDISGLFQGTSSSDWAFNHGDTLGAVDTTGASGTSPYDWARDHGDTPGAVDTTSLANVAGTQGGSMADDVMDWVKKNKMASAFGALTAMSALSGKNKKKPVRPPAAISQAPGSPTIPMDTTFSRRRTEPSDYYHYGETGNRPSGGSFFTNNFATATPRAARGGRFVEGPGGGRDDIISAQLSDGEYVMDAETVAMLGDGSNNEGAKKLDQLRARLRQHKGRALARGKISPNAGDPTKYLGGKV